ncbi:prenyltransferase/squalene oxidase repeat-containing protein [Streptomyces sp. NPDC051561]|uniref:prenyltransferase/squalene oxidase repeat-containing protein n=1 Tax=Streptomyces sp. NPDC051561 TaxID=3365658 RepID=UPI0037A4D183
MTLRRSAAALAATAVLGAVAAPAAVAAPTPSPVALPSGLYGKGDPTYDGVFRQSLALLAQDTVGVKPAAKAVDWLVGQQCDNGGFAAYRADAGKACDPKDPKVMLDSNATASAVQALSALGGQDAAAQKAVGWLRSVQNADGGWPYVPGTPSDANSTSLVIGALVAAGEKPKDIKGKDWKSPLEALLDFQVKCDGDASHQGAFAFQPDKAKKLFPNADATASVVTASALKGLVVQAPKAAKELTVAPACKDGMTTPEAAVAGGADYLSRTLEKNGSHLKSAMPGAEDKPDFGNTADAVVALAAGDYKAAAAKPAEWLAKNSAAWAKGAGPAAYAQLIFAAHATGMDPRSFGGADLVAQLNATGPAPESQPGAGKDGTKDSAEEKKSDDGGSTATWWIVGIAFVASMGAGFLISGRNKKNQQL